MPLQGTLSLKERSSYVRVRFGDFSSAFITVLPERLVFKLSDQGLPLNTCIWIKVFPSDRLQRVWVGSHTSTDLKLRAAC